MDLELNVFHDGRHHVYLSQVRHDALLGGWTIDLAGDLLGEVTRGIHPRNRLDVHLSSAGGIASVPPAAAGRPEIPGDHITWPECSDWLKQPPKLANTTVATAIARNGVRIETTYSSSATTESGVGASYNGGFSFTQEGKRSRTARFTGYFYDRKAKRGKAIHREYLVEWRHHVQDRHCQLSLDGPAEYQVITSPDIATGGFGDRKSRYVTWQCNDKFSRRAGGFKVETENARAKTYASAFSFQPLGRGGFIGTARSGYDESARVTFHFKGRRGGHWCGDTDVPAAANQRVQAYQ